MSRYSGILAMGKKHYPSLVFDFSQLNNVADYFQEYKIPTEEKPIVYAYSGQFFSFRLEGSGTLITDEAIYFHPSHKDWAKSNRLPLSEICSYVIFQETARDHVSLISGQGEMRIFGRTVAPHDTTGTELVELLKALQQALITGSKEKKEFEKTLGFVLALIRESFRENGLISGKYRILLDQIAEYPGFATEIAFIRAENYYRLCNEAEYYRYIQSLDDDVDADVRQSLQNPDMLFFDRYVRHIANISAFYMKKALIEPYLNLKRQDRLTLHQCLLLCFLCIRLDDRDYFKLVYDMIRIHLDTDDFWNLSGFAARSCNEKMAGVYEHMRSGKELTQQEYLLRDALGLSPLHYALILRNKSLALKLLNEYDWSAYSFPPIRDRLVCDAYRFVFVASCLFDDVSFISKLLLRTEASAKPLARTLKQLNTSIGIHSSLLEKAVSQSKIEDIQFHRSQIDEYELLKTEVEEELERMTVEAIKSSRKRAEGMISGKDSLAKYLLHLYLTPDGLRRVIEDTAFGWRVHRYENLFFVTPCDYDLSLSFFEWKNGKVTLRRILESALQDEEGEGLKEDAGFDGERFINPEQKKQRRESEERRRQEERRRESQKSRHEENRWRYRRSYRQTAETKDMPFPGSYFSPQAHKNIRILKQEYRKVVKRYHPDSGGSAKDVEIMIRIMNERADILERIDG